MSQEGALVPIRYSDLNAGQGGQGPFECTGLIEQPQDKTYSFWFNVPFAGTFTKVTTKCETGTAVFTPKVNGGNFNGGASNVSLLLDEVTHTQSVAVGDDIVFQISSVSSCTDLYFGFEYTIA